MKPVGAVEKSTKGVVGGDAKASLVVTQRALIERLSSEPGATCLVVNAHGSQQQGPEWTPLQAQQRTAASPRLVAPEFRNGIIAAFAASRHDSHVVSATIVESDPGQLRQLHLVSLAADDPDGTGEDLIFIITFPDDHAKPLLNQGQTAPVEQRWISYTCDGAGVLLSCDPTIEGLLGWTEEDLVGTPILGIIHPDDIETSINRWLAATQAAEPVRGRVRLRSKTGDWKSFEVTNTNLLLTDGFVRCDLLDITSEVEAVNELAAREEVLRRLAEALPSGIVQFDRDGKLIFANRRLAEITGVIHGKIQDYLELFDPATQLDIQELALSIYTDAIEVDMEAELHRADGHVRYTRLAFRPLLVDHRGAGGVLICVDDITESWTLRKELARQANTDGLTGVANRSASHDALLSAISDRRSSGTGVVFFDLNGFKTANDNHGHAHGDDLLVTFAKRLSDQARDTDTVGRVGGDEFIMIVPDVEIAQLAMIAKRLLDNVNAAGHELHINASCGYTLVGPIDFDSSGPCPKAAIADRAISEADAAMYVHKRSPGPWPVQFDQSFLPPEVCSASSALSTDASDKWEAS